MKVLLLVFAIGLTAMLGRARGEEVIKSYSPDGAFALRLVSAAGGSAATMIRGKSHEAMTGEDELQVSTEFPDAKGETKLVWSADSQWVAYHFTERTRARSGSSVQVFLRRGAKFEEALLPELPRPKLKAAAGAEGESETRFEKLTPLRWSKPATLTLWYEVDLGNAGWWKREVAIGFDQKGKATVLKVERVK